MPIDYAEDMWVDAFRPGVHIDASGKCREWTETDCKTIADNYNKVASPDNPDRRIAPVVIGHPQTDSPAYGWIDQARFTAGKLQLKLTQLNDQFVKMLKDGAYKARSISLYPDLSIRHLGFLGGAQPAVAGLGPFKFNDSSDVITIQFEEQDMGVDKQEFEELKRENSFFKKLFNRFKVEVVANHAEEDEDKDDKETEHEETPDGEETPEQKKKRLEEALADKDKKEESDMSETVKAKDKQIADLTAKLADIQTNSRKAEYKQFAEKLVSEGRLRPADLNVAIENMELRFAADGSQFAENQTTPKLDAYRTHLAEQPQIVQFGEMATPRTAAVNPQAVDAEKKVNDFCQAYLTDGKAKTWAEANLLCASEHPDEYRQYMDISIN